MKRARNYIRSHPISSHVIFSFVVALLLTNIIFLGVKDTSFFFLGDEFQMFSNSELFLISFPRNPHDLGFMNGMIMIVNFYDRLYYFFIQWLGISSIQAQPFLYFIKIFISIVIPFLGFRKLGELYKEKSQGKIFIISLWYSFNTYTLLNWNGGFFLTLLVVYIFAPLALYFYHKAIFERFSVPNMLIAAIILFSMSFLVYLSAVFYIFLLIYTFFISLNKKRMISATKHGFILLGFMIPLFIIYIPIILDFFHNSAGISGSLGASTAGIINGGFLYQMLLWSMWPIYTYWEPRNSLTFHNYLTTPLAIISPFILYAIILFSFLKKRTYYSAVFMFSFLFFVFFAKGPQYPLGEVYTFLINNFLPFVLFRSPDNKFGFGIILSIALLLLVSAYRFSNKFFIITVTIVIIIQTLPLLDGSAVRGKHSSASWERMISIPPEHKEIADYVNTKNMATTYVMPLPSNSYTQFWLKQDQLFIGQDLLPKLIPLPFIHLEEYSGMPGQTYKKLQNVFRKEEVQLLSTLPIRYIIVRRDIRVNKIDKEYEQEIKKTFPLVYENKYFSLYENKNAALLVNGSNTTFQKINPVTYKISISSLKADQNLMFLQSYNSGWELYPIPILQRTTCAKVVNSNGTSKECLSSESFLGRETIIPLTEKALFQNTHVYGNGYANQWTISPEKLQVLGKEYIHKNKNGTVDIEMLLYFKPYLYFILATAVSFIFFSVYSIYILIVYLKKRHV